MPFYIYRNTKDYLPYAHFLNKLWCLIRSQSYIRYISHLLRVWGDSGIKETHSDVGLNNT